MENITVMTWSKGWDRAQDKILNKVDFEMWEVAERSIRYKVGKGSTENIWHKLWCNTYDSTWCRQKESIE